MSRLVFHFTYTATKTVDTYMRHGLIFAYENLDDREE